MFLSRTMLSALTALTLVAPVSGAPAASKLSARREILPWMADDWAGALAKAKRLDKPIFVEAWAPW